MRLFVGLDIDDPIRDRVSRFLEGVREFAPDARWVRPESLHITLKFIGEQKPERLDALKSALAGNHLPRLRLFPHAPLRSRLLGWNRGRSQPRETGGRSREKPGCRRPSG